MKLYSFTTVKDEEDIIESFVRYNMNILDGMVISDNGSNDDTLKILYQLKDEGYNIDIIEDKSKTFNQYIRRNELVAYTAKKYKPDWILPLDADEFISTDSKCNPRIIIENLDKNALYLYKMINFVITRDDDMNELFVPKRIKKIRKLSKSYEYQYKCIISDAIYNDKDGIDIAQGAHFAVYKSNKKMKNVVLDDIWLAHYTVRSVNQYINKTIQLGLNQLKLVDEKSGLSGHKFYFMDKIIQENGVINDEEIYEFSLYSDLIDGKTRKVNKKCLLGVLDKTIDLSFCKDIDIKYTKNSNISNESILKNTLKLSKNIISDLKKEKDQIHSELENCISAYDKEIDRLNKCNENTNNALIEYRTKYQQILNSKWWKLRSILFFWKK